MKNNIRTIILTAFVALGVGMWMPQLSLRPVSAQTAAVLSGSYGFEISQPVGPTNPGFNAALGVLKFDGKGGLALSQTFVETDTAAGAATVKVQEAAITGTYTQNTDGTGVLSVDIGAAAPATFAFVVTDGGNALRFVSTNTSNVITLGSARKQ